MSSLPIKTSYFEALIFGYIEASREHGVTVEKAITTFINKYNLEKFATFDSIKYRYYNRYLEHTRYIRGNFELPEDMTQPLIDRLNRLIDAGINAIEAKAASAAGKDAE